jgi:hypothetical protein
MGLGRAQLEDVVEDEASELSLLLAYSEPVSQHGEETIHELEAAEAEGLYALGLVSQIGEYLQDGLPDFR